jgi:hypothetical protein
MCIVDCRLFIWLFISISCSEFWWHDVIASKILFSIVSNLLLRNLNSCWLTCIAVSSLANLLAWWLEFKSCAGGRCVCGYLIVIDWSNHGRNVCVGLIWMWWCGSAGWWICLKIVVRLLWIVLAKKRSFNLWKVMRYCGVGWGGWSTWWAFVLKGAVGEDCLFGMVVALWCIVDGAFLQISNDDMSEEVNVALYWWGGDVDLIGAISIESSRWCLRRGVWCSYLLKIPSEELVAQCWSVVLGPRDT